MKMPNFETGIEILGRSLRLYRESSRSYPGRSAQQAVSKLLHVGKPGGRNRKSQETNNGGVLLQARSSALLAYTKFGGTTLLKFLPPNPSAERWPGLFGQAESIYNW